MIRSIILCALFLGVANAARQIPVNPSPPPPGPTQDNVPGALVSVMASGYSSATWTSAMSNAVCAALKANYTSNQYPKDRIVCQVNNVVDTAAHAAAAVQTQLYWSDFYGSTQADKDAAKSSRDLFLNTLQSNPDNIVVGNTVADVNNTCNAAWVPTATQTTSGVYTPIAGMPLVQCRSAVLGLSGSGSAATNVESYTAGTGSCATPGGPSTPISVVSGLCFTSASTSTIGSYGIDNGKICPKGAGFIQPVAAPSIQAFGTGTLTAAQATTSASLQTLTISSGTVSAALSAPGFIDGQSFARISLSAADLVPSSAACTAAEAASFLYNTPSMITAFSQTTVTNAVMTLTIDWSVSKCGIAPSLGAAIAAATGVTANTVGFAHSWSPYCDSNQAFYTKFNKLATAPSAGAALVCPACGSSTSDIVRFTYAGTNAGKACSTGSAALKNGGVVGNPTDVQAAGYAGTPCIQVGVNNAPSSSVDAGKPMLTAASLVPYPYSPNTYAFPSSAGCTQSGIQAPCAGTGVFPSSSVTAYNGGSRTIGTDTVPLFQSLALDTEFNMMCSTPTLRAPIPGALMSTDIVGGYFLGNTAGAAKGAGTCNTQSAFYNGGILTGTGSNGIAADTRSLAALPTTFLAPIEGPIAPPKPAPAPGPTPRPTPPTPTVCTYRGSYEITPLYGPCDKYYLASGTADDCSYNLVTLRTKSQLGKKFARIRWGFATIAEAGLSTPTNVVGEARISAKGTCTNRFLAAPSDPKTLKVGGSSWKWQFVPYPGSDKCDRVNMISQNRLATTAFLEVPRTCDRFRWNATDGGRQRFRLRKVA